MIFIQGIRGFACDHSATVGENVGGRPPGGRRGDEQCIGGVDRIPGPRSEALDKFGNDKLRTPPGNQANLAHDGHIATFGNRPDHVNRWTKTQFRRQLSPWFEVVKD
jgi:hypothetical protein